MQDYRVLAMDSRKVILRNTKYKDIVLMLQIIEKKLFRRQPCAKIPTRYGILYPQDPESEMLENLGSCIFIFSWDLGILDPVTAALS